MAECLGPYHEKASQSTDWTPLVCGGLLVLVNMTQIDSSPDMMEYGVCGPDFIGWRITCRRGGE